MNKILNFGSLNIDKVYKMPHIVRPGETLSSDELSIFCGGKGLNQSIALKRAGGEVYHAGKIGLDGDILKEELLKNEIDISFLEQSEGYSGHAIIQVEHKGQNCILLYGGSNREISPDRMDMVLDNFDSSDIIVCQNEINDMPLLLKKAAQRNIPVALNPSPIDESILSCDLTKVSFLIVNEIEGEEFTGQKEPKKICEELLKLAPDIKIVLTVGKNGVIYCDKENYFTHGIFDVKVVDTTGAGDTFLGFFVAAVLKAQGGNYKEIIPRALKLASAASSIAVSKNGAAASIPTLAEVEEFLKGR